MEESSGPCLVWNELDINSSAHDHVVITTSMFRSLSLSSLSRERDLEFEGSSIERERDPEAMFLQVQSAANVDVRRVHKEARKVLPSCVSRRNLVPSGM